MSNALIERKQKLEKYLSNKDIENRIISLSEGDIKKAEKIKSVIKNLALIDNNLRKCTLESIIQSALTAIETGLPISKSLGTLWFVPYKNKKGEYQAQAQIGYKGWKALALQDGILAKPIPVFDVDDFNVEFDGIEEKYHLVPNLKERHLGDDKWVKEHLVGVLVSVKYTNLNGETEVHYVPRDVLNKLIAVSKAKNSSSSPYNSGWWLEMVVYARALSYVLRKVGVTGDKIAKAFELENASSDLSLLKEKESLVEDILDVDVEEIDENEVKGE